MRTAPLALLLTAFLTFLPLLIGQGRMPADNAVRKTRALRSAAFYMENDVFVAGGSNEDRNYTGGFGFLFTGNFVNQFKLNVPLIHIDRLVGMDGVRGAKFDEHHDSVLFFGTGFTPDDLSARLPIRNDRPYASLTALTVTRLSVETDDHAEAWTTDLTVGLLGLSIARNLQTKIHRELRRNGDVVPVDPLGWHNQISDGGEPSLLYRTTYEKRLLRDDPDAKGRKWWELSGGFQLSAGYYTNAAVLANLRIGSFNSHFWQFTPGALSGGAQKLDKGKMEDRGEPWEWFVFGGLRSRAVVYNALLQGQFRDSAHTISPKRLLLEWDAGVSVYLPRVFGSRLSTQLVWNANCGRTPEFEGSSRSHRWGSLYLVLSGSPK